MNKLTLPTTLRTLALATIGVIVLNGCGGTKVYEATKSVVYKGSIYNLSDVKTVIGTIEGIAGEDKKILDLKNVDRKTFENYVKEYDTLFVRMAYKFDDQEMVYRASSVDTWRDFDKMKRDFEGAGEKIADLLKNKKSTQIELR